jgi:6-phosphogluconolactonase
VTARTGDRVDWTAVDVWWGDERFVPAGDDDRNEKAARRALLDVVGVPESRVQAMPASDGEFPEPEDAAAWYAGKLAAAAPPGRELPRFDVLLLGIGPEGHTASIFPDSPAAQDQRAVLAVRNCPKPPPTRVSLGFSAINTADEVWLVVAGEDKAPAVARAVAGADAVELPAAGVHGTRATRWWLDRAAAGRLPGQVVAAAVRRRGAGGAG